jgi:predicted acyl esterase
MNLTSADDPPVRYVMFRGFAPSFDGMPMSVDVTIPCGASGPIPLVVMSHGWSDDKTIWEETGRSNKKTSDFRPGSNSFWNNIWFASRGYAVLNYTARGWHDSCGPRAPGATPLSPSPDCLAYEYWIHMDDQRWEVRDVQFLTAALVESGVADPSRLAITGGSYGGGVTIQAALLNDRIVCGAVAQPPELGADPCAGRDDGEMASWQTRNGTPLHWSAAVPQYTFGDVVHALLPNGRGSDGVAAPDGDHTEPVGVAISSFLAGIYAAGQPSGNGFYAPPGIDGPGNITLLTARTLAGNPYPRTDPLIAYGMGEWRRFRSAIAIEPRGEVPIFWTHGLTDPLFTAFEPLQIRARLGTAYPMKMFFGDLGHDYAAEREDEWDHAHVLMNEFVDHFLKDEGGEPDYDVTAAVTRCLDPDAAMTLVTAPTWAELSNGVESFEAAGDPQGTSNAPPSPVGIAADPVLTAALPGPQSYKGCRILDEIVDPNAATHAWTLDHDVTLLGAPLVEVSYSTTAPDAELNVRLWDVTPAGKQALVTRGTYRSTEIGPSLAARFAIAPQGYRWRSGHSIKLEITANDAPYRQPNNFPGTVVVTSATLTLPVRSVSGSGQ